LAGFVSKSTSSPNAVTNGFAIEHGAGGCRNDNCYRTGFDTPTLHRVRISA
jgi:hypothetical protein